MIGFRKDRLSDYVEFFEGMKDAIGVGVGSYVVGMLLDDG